MKKRIIIALAFFAFTAVQAQVSVKPGIRAGVNFSKFTSADTQLKPNFYVGGTLGIKFTKVYTLQPELSYSRQGANVTEYYQSSTDGFDPAFYVSQRKTKYELNYLTLGIINKFTFGKGFQVAVGPSLDFKVSDNFAGNNSNRPIDFDLSLVAGIGYAFSNGITIEARLKQGLVDIFGYEVYNDYNDYDYDYQNDNYYSYNQAVLNQVIQLGVSYSFDLK